jgi:predicted secreted protein
MQASMRADAENASAALAANDVNSRIASALTVAKAATGVEVQTASYSTYPMYDKNQVTRWHVSQSITLEGSDFAAVTALVSRLQSENGLLLSGISFTLSPKARAAAEDKLTQQAVSTWQQRAASAARSFHATGWRAGRISIQGSDYGRPIPVQRMSAMAVESKVAPVNVEAGTSDITVTVSGEAILEGAPPVR